MSETTIAPEKQSTSINLSVGSGIAITGIWLMGAAVTLTLFFATFVYAKAPNVPENADDLQQFFTAMFVVIVAYVIALPMITAFRVTKMILGIKD